MDLRHTNTTAVVKEFCPERISEPGDRVLRSAIRCLQGDATERQRRTYLNDDAGVARPHVLQRGERAVDDAKVRDIGYAPDLLWGHFDDRREDARHGVV